MAKKMDRRSEELMASGVVQLHPVVNVALSETLVIRCIALEGVDVIMDVIID